MGVTGLWTVVQPCARPIKLETLNRKRLAVDASIWIYQFLKAVRDKEGNALRNSHIVGFFRRICKLLFFGIKPVFVFDGGAPILKRQTIVARKQRREGRRDDAVRTAGKLLAVQMQRRAEEDDQKLRDQKSRGGQSEEPEQLPDDLVYVDELHLTEQERTNNRFKKKDQYHLPNLDVDISNLGAPNDPRIMSHEELEEYARQFHRGEDVAMYDFSKIDFDSTFFTSLPPADRYNILNAARLRSRLRMGYSKEQLDTMFPNRMDFSRFQIERVTERNELTQRLMNINGMNGEDATFDMSGRIAGERGKEYVLVKNDGVEGGWALGVVTNKGEGEKEQPINVEDLGKRELEAEDEGDEWEDEGFEDVPIEGLNRLPSHLRKMQKNPSDRDEDALKRRAIYESRLERAGRSKPEAAQPALTAEQDGLFIEQEQDAESEASELFEDVPTVGDNEEDAELQRAIQLSLETGEDHEDEEYEHPSFASVAHSGPRIDQPLQFNPKNAKAGRAFAHLTNNRAHGSAPKGNGEDSDEDDFNLQAGLEELRKDKPKYLSGPRVHGFKRSDTTRPAPARTPVQNAAATPSRPATTGVGLGGPLPFEALSLGSSILGQKKKRPAPEAEGGFEKEKDKPKQPLPPWFAGDIREDVAKQNAIEETQYDGGDPARRPKLDTDEVVFRRQDTGDVIDVDAPAQKDGDVVSVQSSDEGEPDDVIMEEVRPIEKEVKMNDVAELARVEPPAALSPTFLPPVEQTEGEDQHHSPPSDSQNDHDTQENSKEPSSTFAEPILNRKDESDTDEANIDWSESEPEKELPETNGKKQQVPIESVSKSPTPLSIQPKAAASPPRAASVEDEAEMPQAASVEAGFHDDDDDAPNAAVLEALDADDSHAYSDAEDEELMRQLAIEAEEHARFASSLNAKSHLQNVEEYERELRQLRNQQKKDRRDADEVSHIMVTECQQLLRLFGLPYITAPMEAEAQCASLVSLGLVDGIVTDDSDCFLFGGTRIYKNMFNQAKFVECYLTSDLEKEYGLTREKLIRFAHLLGSDYTEGLPLVGPVTALEILSEFETLEQFAEWWSNIQMTPKPRAEDIATPFRKKFRKNASKIFLPTVFPDTRVDHAYLHPEVDDDPQPFQWGVPDLDALRSFLMATIGWNQERTDEVLVPVIKDINRRENEGTQANITAFFGGSVGVGARQPVPNSARAVGGEGPSAAGGEGYAPRRRAQGKSKRMEDALGRLQEKAQGRSRGEDEEEAQENGNGAAASKDQPTKPKKSRTRGKKRVVNESEDESHGPTEGDDATDDAEYAAPKKGKSKRRKKDT